MQCHCNSLVHANSFCFLGSEESKLLITKPPKPSVESKEEEVRKPHSLQVIICAPTFQ